ncbi:unnamed protein product [Caenorhabditis auriculariae]|uniref:Uncharacterized protein n=1 Tax=Caenorhabditis auriculariae TaxID=2777116 RepID=A0A8S1GYR2_9PELO|nr:unnamed protein product [Caenorhabditis auriculariae]
MAESGSFLRTRRQRRDSDDAGADGKDASGTRERRRDGDVDNGAGLHTDDLCARESPSLQLFFSSLAV